jgi:acyl dehydratase
MKTFESPEALEAMVGNEIGLSDWLLITQERVNQFAEATDDPQWIHIDEVRAKQESPYGGTIAHGYLTLALLPKFFANVIQFPFAKMNINYGANKLRFPAPMRVGLRMRARFTLLGVERLPDCIQSVWKYTAEQESGDKPVCVAEVVLRQYF